MSPSIHLVLLSSDRSDPSVCLVLDVNGRILEQRMLLAASTPAAAAANIRMVVAVPGEGVRTSFLNLPLRRPIQARAAALLLLDGELAGDAPAHLALGEPDGRRLACIASPDQMDAWLAQCATMGFSPDVLIPDYLLLPARGGTDACVVLASGERRLVRGPGLAFSAEAAVADLVLAEHPRAPTLAGAEALALLAKGALDPVIDLQQAAFGRRRADDPDARRVRRLRTLAVLLLASPLILVAAEALRLELSGRLLHHRSQALAVELTGSHAAHLDPVAAVDASLARLQGGGGFYGLTRALMQSVNAQPGVRLEAIEYGGLQLQADLAHVDPGAARAVADALQASGTKASLEQAQPGADGLRSRIRLGGPR